MNKYFLLLALFFVGFFIRVFFSFQAIETPVYDMSGYYTLGKSFVSGTLLSDCCDKNHGYAVFIGSVGYFFGIENLIALRYFQILLDLGSAFLIFLIARILFKEKIAIVACALYLLNPFTSAFTGLRLPEVVTGFYLILLGYILSRSDFFTRIVFWVIYGFLMGIIVFTRMSFFYFSIFCTFFIGLVHFKLRRTVVYFFGVILLWFIIASLYTLTSNYVYFKKVSFVSPYNRLFGQLYGSFYYKEYPELFVEFNNAHIDERYTNILVEYGSVTPSSDQFGLQSSEGILVLNEKYKHLFFEKMVTQWPQFIFNTGRNIVWLWDKKHLYVYEDPFYPKDLFIVRTINIFSLLMFFMGFILFIRNNGIHVLRKPFILFTIVIFLYTSIFFGMVSNESRQTIPLYGFIYLWASYGLVKTWSFLKRRFHA